MRQHEIITERFKNLFSEQDKKKYLDGVWKLLSKSYQYAGGLRVGGITEPNDLLSIPMWKLIVKNGVVHGIVLYKDKNGRKSIAAGTDGSRYGKLKLVEILLDDMLRGRSYGEKSKAALGLALKKIPRDMWDNIMKTPQQAQEILGKELTPLSDIPENEWPEDAKITIAKYPELEKYGYVRELVGAPAFKVMMGTPYNKIV